MAVVAMVVLSSLGLALMSNGSQPNSATVSYVSHSPIHIAGDADLAVQAASEHWGGSGTALDPYLINGSAGQGYQIDATGFSDGIFINNTRAHFRIPGALIANGAHSAVHLANATNGTITGSTMTSGRDGIWIENSSSNISIVSTICSANPRDGVFIDHSDNMTISGADCDDNSWDGIFLTYTDDINVGNSSCENNTNDGIRISVGSRIVIDNNTCTSSAGDNNGISVYDFIDCKVSNNRLYSGSTLPQAGILLSGSTISPPSAQNALVVNNSITMYCYGIDVFQVTNFEVRDCTVSQSFDGIRCRYSTFLRLFMDEAGNCTGDGLYLYQCSDFRVQNCTSCDNSNSGGINVGVPVGALIENSTFDRNFDGLILYGGSGGITICNNSVSNNTAGSDSMGMRLANNGAMTIDDNLCCNNSNAGIYFNSADSPRLERNIANYNVWGIYMSGVTSGVLRNNTMVRDGIFLTGGAIQYYDSQSIDTSNTVNGKPVRYYNAGDYGWATVPAGAGQVLVASSSHLKISGQNLSRASVGIELAFSDWINITGNSIWYNFEGIYADYITNCVISSGNVVNCSSDNGIYIIYGGPNTIVNNTVGQNAYGISLYGAVFDTVETNRVTDNSIGIYVRGEWGDEIMDNVCIDNSDVGIYVNSFDNSTVHNNTCYGSTSVGMGVGILIEYCYDCQYYGNIVSNNTVGISLSDANRNSFEHNLIGNSTSYGMQIDPAFASLSHRNRIFNNTFLYNNGATDTYSASHVQASDSGVDNKWNTSGSPHGYGNYWSDWTTPDVNGNGIVDVNYTLDGVAGAVSYWPLTTKPWVPIPEGDLLVLVCLMGAAFVLSERRARKKG
jgi:parallel beta-helix repeat protein